MEGWKFGRLGGKVRFEGWNAGMYKGFRRFPKSYLQTEPSAAGASCDDDDDDRNSCDVQIGALNVPLLGT